MSSSCVPGGTSSESDIQAILLPSPLAKGKEGWMDGSPKPVLDNYVLTVFSGPKHDTHPLTLSDSTARFLLFLSPCLLWINDSGQLDLRVRPTTYRHLDFFF